MDEKPGSNVAGRDYYGYNSISATEISHYTDQYSLNFFSRPAAYGPLSLPLCPLLFQVYLFEEYQ